MPTVTVIARDTFPYAGQTRYKGDRFECSTQDARLLMFVGRVKEAPPERPRLEPVADPEPEAPSDVAPVKRSSRRRVPVEDVE